MGRKRKPYNPATVHDRMAKEINRGQRDFVAPIDIDDPYAAGDKIRVMRALRDDPLARLHCRRQIDEAQYHAGRAFQRDFEAAERGPKAIDFTREAVDGGEMPEAITEPQRKAAKRLAGVYRDLGQDGSAIAHDVLVHGLTAAAVAMRRGVSGRRFEEYFAMRFRECLDCLAKFYGLANEASERRRIVVEAVQ